MKITADWLREKHACRDGVAWWADQTETEGAAVVGKLIDDDIITYGLSLIEGKE